MALDVCPPAAVHGTRCCARRSDRTATWAERARDAFLAPGRRRRAVWPADSTRPSSASARAAPTRLAGESATQIAALGFDGYGIGGLSVGESRDEMLPALAAAIEHLPADQPGT